MGKLKVIGIKGVLKDLAEFGESAERGVQRVTFDAAKTIEEQAIRNVPVNYGKIKQSINTTTVSHYFYTVNVNAVPIAAYVEFGTGVKVKVPTEWTDLAWQFYVNGEGMLPPSPYLYPAYQVGKREYETKLKQLLEVLKTKYG